MKMNGRMAWLRGIIQRDAGNRGLARDPAENVFTALPGDLAAACISLAESGQHVGIVTGFFIPTARPPAFETDGPPGAVWLAAALSLIGFDVRLFTVAGLERAFQAGLAGLPAEVVGRIGVHRIDVSHVPTDSAALRELTHLVFIECVGPAADGRCYSMRGVDVTETPTPGWWLFGQLPPGQRPKTIGIGDGGNEIGMGKIESAIVRRNIPLGEKIHCRIRTDELIVAGVSNWGAYALAAGVGWFRGSPIPESLFDADAERQRLERMVAAGPLVDGVTGQQEATVDGLSWDDYVQPLIEIGRWVRG